jgi:hypothetical protein
MARFALILTLLLAASAAPARADDADLWATVNVCDTAAHPDEVGIRASMPGGKRGTRLLMRFRVQYRDLSTGRWRAVRDADSGWRKAGKGRPTREAGWSFEVAGEGTRILRGVVTYRWKRNGHAVRNAKRVTAGGHRSTDGADPADFSAATCLID